MIDNPTTLDLTDMVREYVAEKGLPGGVDSCDGEAMRALTERLFTAKMTTPITAYTDDYLHLDTIERKIYVQGEPVKLYGRPFEILAFLTLAQVPISNAQLSHWVWRKDEDQRGNIKWQICNLRKSIEQDPANPQRIITLINYGYKYVPLGQPIIE